MISSLFQAVSSLSVRRMCYFSVFIIVNWSHRAFRSWTVREKRKPILVFCLLILWYFVIKMINSLLQKSVDYSIMKSSLDYLSHSISATKPPPFWAAFVSDSGPCEVEHWRWCGLAYRWRSSSSCRCLMGLRSGLYEGQLFLIRFGKPFPGGPHFV